MTTASLCTRTQSKGSQALMSRHDAASCDEVGNAVPLKANCAHVFTSTSLIDLIALTIHTKVIVEKKFQLL